MKRVWIVLLGIVVSSLLLGCEKDTEPPPQFGTEGGTLPPIRVADRVSESDSAILASVVADKQVPGPAPAPGGAGGEPGEVIPTEEGEPPRPSDATTPNNQEPSHTVAGREFLQTKLAELDSFKSDPKFHELGFGVGGPFNAWLKSVEAKRGSTEFSRSERIAVGDLQQLGLEYMKTKGRENDYTRWAREQITEQPEGPVGIE